MRQDVKERWLEALRGGEYEQTKGQLRRIDSEGKARFCCLGVLCDLYCTENGIGFDSLKLPLSESTGDPIEILPRAVMEWAGLDERDPEKDFNASLSSLNDDGESFESIADEIEAKL